MFIEKKSMKVVYAGFSRFLWIYGVIAHIYELLSLFTSVESGINRPNPIPTNSSTIAAEVINSFIIFTYILII